MRFSFETIEGLREALEADLAAGRRAVSAAVREAARGLKSAWRAQIVGAGLGSRLARSIRDRAWPAGRPSLNTAALVWAAAPDIVSAHDRGVLIRSKTGFWLAIPTEAAPRGLRGGRITPGEFEQRTGLRLRFVYRRGRPSLLVAEGRLGTGRAAGRFARSRSTTGRGLTTVPIFVLVPQVRLAKRLDLARDAEAWAARLPALIAEGWRD